MSGTNDSLATDVANLLAVRYLTFAGFTVLIYDIFLTIADEASIVWTSGRWTVPKAAYVVNRYGSVILSMFYLSFLLPVTNRSDTWVSANGLLGLQLLTCFQCRNSGMAVMILDVSIETLGNGIVLYELIILWKAARRTSWLMAAGYILLHSTTIVSLAITVLQMKSSLRFQLFFNNMRVCVSTRNPPGFKGVYIPAVVLDVYAFALLFTNALSRPRASSQKLLDLLWSDGFIFFLTFLAMRMMCLIINLVAPPSLAVLGLSFASTIVATAVSRLYLRLNGPARRATYLHPRVESIYGNDYLLAEETELQVRTDIAG
ncbi:hypothetical protein M0805_001876 [Coniferiporia weirii]|nr:hypothetical protein M0805_001876 [Coniferiporia weirii]